MEGLICPMRTVSVQIVTLIPDVQWKRRCLMTSRTRYAEQQLFCRPCELAIQHRIWVGWFRQMVASALT